MNSKKLILLPGLGADERLLEPQRAVFPDLIVPRWLTPKHRESLPAYAERMALNLIEDGSIRMGDSTVLGGVSFGGMLALELARHIKCDAVIQIGSCRSGAAIPHGFRAAYQVWKLMPDFLWRPNEMTIPVIMGQLGAAKDARYAGFIAGLRATPPKFLRWGCGAILDWRPSDFPNVKIVQVHGRHDRLIPLSWLDPLPDVVLARGAHLINLICADEVNAVIRETLVQ